MRNLKTIKCLLLTFCLTFVSVSGIFGQTKMEIEEGVGIGTTKPDRSAVLDISSKSKGLLIPRMSLTERASILSPASGLMVYQTNMLSGLYVYDGTKWSLVTGNKTEAKLQANELTSWGTLGNSDLNSSLNFIGTTDTTSLNFKVNNFQSGIIDYKRGMSTFGYKAGIFTTGYNSVIIGALAMQKPNIGGNNIAIGYQTLFSNEKGDYNVGVGSGALASNILSEKNTAIGALAGYKSTGVGNVFLGFQAGYFETSNNKLHISNDASRVSLIYGDFSAARVGINTSSLTTTFTINSNESNKSGLSFEKLNSNSPASEGNRKVLALNSVGEVILVNDYSESASASYWQQIGNNILNKNSGNVLINKDATVAGQLKSNSILLGSGGLSFSDMGDANGKALSLDKNGKVILVNNQVSNPTATSTNGTTNLWSIDAEDKVTNSTRNVQIQRNLGVEGTIFTNEVLTKGIAVGENGLKFTNLNSKSTTQASNGKVLSVNEDGHVFLTKESSGSITNTFSDSFWKTENGTIVTKNNEKVVIGTGITKLPDGFNLYVKNGILAERVRVAVANSDKWADYVFDRNYKLMPIKDVAKFIEEYKHLPNVPSAQEVANNGIDMAEIAAKQMEKIEELTLYLIQANERIEKLEAKVEAMKK